MVLGVNTGWKTRVGKVCSSNFFFEFLSPVECEFLGISSYVIWFCQIFVSHLGANRPKKLLFSKINGNYLLGMLLHFKVGNENASVKWKHGRTFYSKIKAFALRSLHSALRLTKTHSSVIGLSIAALWKSFV